MQFPPESMFHLSAGVIGLISGVTALFSRKGGRLHRTSGAVFMVAMVTTAASGVALGFMRGQAANAIAGVITLYLLITGWMAVRRREGKAGLFEGGAFLFAAALAAAAYYFTFLAMQNGTAMLGGIPSLIFASILALAAIADLTVILRRGIAGKQRIARHLWRMHLGFAAAVGSFFPGQLRHLAPELLKVKPFIVLFTPPLTVVALMFFWLTIVLFTNWFVSNSVYRRSLSDVAEP